MSDDKEKIEPCPFCNLVPCRYGVYNAYRCEVCCKNQGWLSKNDWNTRPIESSLREQIEELKRVNLELSKTLEDHENELESFQSRVKELEAEREIHRDALYNKGRCMYCDALFDMRTQRDVMATHVTSCEKSPVVQSLKTACEMVEVEQARVKELEEALGEIAEWGSDEPGSAQIAKEALAGKKEKK